MGREIDQEESGSEVMLGEDVVILIAEDEKGHALLIERNLRRSGIENSVVRFRDGQEVLDFFFEEESSFDPGRGYLLLLDIRMPKIKGTQVLQRIKEHAELRIIPVIMITTNDDMEEVHHCYQLGCNGFITKPIIYDRFIDTIRQLGWFLKTLQIPRVRDDPRGASPRIASSGTMVRLERASKVEPRSGGGNAERCSSSKEFFS